MIHHGHGDEADCGPDKGGNRVDAEHRDRLPGDHRIFASGEKRLALAHEQDAGQPEIDQPERDAERSDQDENRKAFGAEHAGEHEGLDQPEQQRAARGGRAQEQIRDRKEAVGRHRMIQKAGKAQDCKAGDPKLERAACRQDSLPHHTPIIYRFGLRLR